MPETFEFGSKPWLDAMYVGPAARKTKGRSRWTHRHAPWVRFLNRRAYVESRIELITILLLEYLYKIGKIIRFKEQAFSTDIEQFGQKYTPDFCLEDLAGQQYLIENKVKRYLTREIEKDLEDLNEKLSAYDMRLLLWTDQDPLTHPLRHNLLRLFKASNEFIRPDEVEQLVSTLRNNGPLSIAELYQSGSDIDLIAYAAWSGKVFVPLLQPLNGQSQVSLSATEDLSYILFNTEPDVHAWWNALEDVA